MQLHILAIPLIAASLSTSPDEQQAFQDSMGVHLDSVHDHLGGAFPPSGADAAVLRTLRHMQQEELYGHDSPIYNASIGEPGHMFKLKNELNRRMSAAKKEPNVTAPQSSNSQHQPQSPSLRGSMPADGEKNAATQMALVPNEDTLDALTSDAESSSVPCSCDCCQVSALDPADFMRTDKGEEIRSICAKPLEGEGIENPTCPSQCSPDNSFSILSAAKGELDYSRFCHYSCRPLADMEGGACIQFSRDLVKKATHNDGNGNEVHVAPVIGRGSNIEFQDADGGNATQGLGNANGTGLGDGNASLNNSDALKGLSGGGDGGTKGSGKADVQVVYDMRKLIAERMRSEAGAMVSAGSSSAEAIRLNLLKSELAAEEAEKANVRATKTASSLEGALVAVQAAKVEAEESERKVKSLVAKSHNFVAGMLKQIKQLTEAAVKKVVAPCIHAAEEDRASGKHLDKPDNWVKVVANRAANPYSEAITQAVQRADEYKRAADELNNRAFDSMRKANDLMPHVNLLRAQGDVVAAAIEKKHVNDLLKSSKNLQAEAQSYWNTANEVARTVPKWQEAAQQAATYATWNYKEMEKVFPN